MKDLNCQFSAQRPITNTSIWGYSKTTRKSSSNMIRWSKKKKDFWKFTKQWRLVSYTKKILSSSSHTIVRRTFLKRLYHSWWNRELMILTLMRTMTKRLSRIPALKEGKWMLKETIKMFENTVKKILPRNFKWKNKLAKVVIGKLRKINILKLAKYQLGKRQLAKIPKNQIFLRACLNLKYPLPMTTEKRLTK